MAAKTHSELLGDFKLVVTPAQMYSTASLLEKNINKSQKSLERIIRLVSNTASYWEGDAAYNERSKFDGEKENFERLISNLLNYAVELKLMTGLYEDSEKGSAEIAQSLPSNVIK